jgi:hypothetical protein
VPAAVIAMTGAAVIATGAQAAGARTYLRPGSQASPRPQVTR